MQDKAIIEIGKLKGAKKELPFQNFVDNLFPEMDNYVMLEVVFVFSTAHEGFDCRFREVDLVNVSTKNYSRYAYRKGSARGGDVTFTTKMGDVDKKFRTFYPKQVEDAIQFSAAKGFTNEEAIFRALKNCLLQEGETVKKQVRQSFESMGKKEQTKTGFSIRCEGLTGRQYLADFDSLQARILQAGTSGKSTKHSVTSEGHHSLCSCCLTQKPLLHGFASPFKYASVDKTGFVSGFFLQKNNWKNYPICSDCALDFELGKKYVAQHLSKNFYDKSYFLIPKLVIGSNPQLLNKVLQLLTDFKYQESDKEQLISREMVLMRRIAREEGQHNRFALNLLFYKERQDKGAIKIRLFLEQIFPSRFRELFISVPEKICQRTLYQNALNFQKQTHDLSFTFAIFQAFFKDEFYDIIQTVFLGQPMSREHFFERVQSTVQKAYIKEGWDKIRRYPNSYFGLTVSKEIKWNTSLVRLAILAFDYLSELSILPNNKTPFSMSIPTDSSLSDSSKKGFDIAKLQAFAEEHPAFLNPEQPITLGVFSLGILVRQVFNLQSRNLEGNTPFVKKLKGFQLNPTTLVTIYVEALNVIQQYTSIHAFKALRDLVKTHFVVNKHQLAEHSNSELSFYFVAGLEFGNNFRSEKA